MSFLKFSNTSKEERKRIFLPSLLLWLMMAGLAIGRAANDTLFIGETGAENLPSVYIFNAFVLAIVSSFYSFLEKHLPRFSFLFWIITFFTVVLIYLRSQLFNHYWWLPYSIFCYYEVLILLVQIHFWTCVNDIFGPREGKRLFPIVGSMGLAGTICGGVFTWLMAPIIGFHNLFFVWIFILVCAIPITALLKRSTSNIEDTKITNRQREFQNIKAAWSVPLVRYLVLLSVPMWVVVHTVDWLFYLSIEEMFKNKPDELSSFLGLLGGFVSLLGMLLQSFVSGPLLKRVGAGLTFSLYSLSMTLCTLLFALRGFLPVGMSAYSSVRSIFPIIIRFLDESVYFSVYDSAVHLLYGALPTAMRGQARALIHGITETGMTAAVGGILSAAVFFQVPYDIVAWFAFGFGLIWIYFSLPIKKHYLNALALNLNSYNVDQHGDILADLSKSNLDPQSRKNLLSMVYGTQEAKAILALRYIQKMADYETLELLGQNVAKTKGVVFQMALQLLSEFQIKKSLSALKQIYVNDSIDRRAAVLSCISHLQPDFILKNKDFFLNSSEHTIRVEVILFLLQLQKRIYPKSRHFQELKAMAYSPDLELKLEAAKVISRLGNTKLAPILIDIAKSLDSTSRSQVIREMGSIKSRDIVTFLVKEMNSEESAQATNAALIQQGDKFLNILHKEFHILKKEPSQNTVALENLISCFGEIGNIKSLSILGSLLGKKYKNFEEDVIKAQADIIHKYKINGKTNKQENVEISKALTKKIKSKLQSNITVIKKLDTIRYALPCIESRKIRDLLENAIEHVSDHSLSMALKCLEILYDPLKVYAATRGIQSDAEREKAEGLEVLEGLGVEGKAISGIVENRFKRAMSNIKNPETLLKECHKVSSNVWLSVCTLYAIGELRLGSLTAIAEDLSKHTNTVVSNSAILSLEKIGYTKKIKLSKKEKERMSIDLERLLFLHSVPIFSDIDPNDIQWINEIVYEKYISAGEYVFHENDSGDSFYIVKEGKIHICKGDVTLEALEHRDHFGEVALFDSQPRTASALVKEDTSLLAIDRKDFQRLLIARPTISLSMFTTLNRRLRELTKKI